MSSLEIRSRIESPWACARSVERSCSASRQSGTVPKIWHWKRRGSRLFGKSLRELWNRLQVSGASKLFGCLGSLPSPHSCPIPPKAKILKRSCRRNIMYYSRTCLGTRIRVKNYGSFSEYGRKRREKTIKNVGCHIHHIYYI